MTGISCCGSWLGTHALKGDAYVRRRTTQVKGWTVRLGDLLLSLVVRQSEGARKACANSSAA
jgi:hypothetical protein